MSTITTPKTTTFSPMLPCRSSASELSTAAPNTSSFIDSAGFDIASPEWYAWTDNNNVNFQVTDCQARTAALAKNIELLVYFPAENLGKLDHPSIPMTLIRARHFLNNLDPQKSRKFPNFYDEVNFYTNKYNMLIKPWCDRVLRNYYVWVVDLHFQVRPGFETPGSLFMEEFDQALTGFNEDLRRIEDSLEDIKKELERVRIEDIIETVVEIGVRLCENFDEPWRGLAKRTN